MNQKQIPWDKNRLERDICVSFYSLVSYLKRSNFFKKDFIIFHIPNEQYTRITFTMMLKKMGLLKGAPDYCCVYENGVAFIEFKRNEKCRLTDAQKNFQQRCKDLNIRYEIVYNENQAVTFLENVLR